MHHLQRPLSESPKNICRDSAQKKRKKTTRKAGGTCPSCAMNKYKMCIKNQKIQNIYKSFIFSSGILQKVDVNQIKPTSAMYFLQSLQGYSLGFYDLILFLNFFNEMQFFILFGIIFQIFWS